jgi:hypothetical protein
MIGISTPTFDAAGARVLSANANPWNGRRRVSRTATLDGGVVVTDMGYADGDRDITVTETDPALETVEYVRYICETYGVVVVSMADGLYYAAPKRFEVRDGGKSLVFELMITEKIT